MSYYNTRSQSKMAAQSENMAAKSEKMAAKSENIMGGDFQLIPRFKGNVDEDAKLWLTRLELWIKSREVSNEKAAAMLPLLLADSALLWYVGLSDDVKSNLKDLKAAFLSRYGPDERTKWSRVAALYQTHQGQSEAVQDFVSKMRGKAASLDMGEAQLVQAIINGLRPEIRQFVLQRDANTIAEIVSSATLAETTVTPQGNTSELVAAIARLEKQVQEMSVQMINANTVQQASGDSAPKQGQQPNWYSAGQWQAPRYCAYCGREPHARSRCAADGQTCSRCGKVGHFARVCRSAPQSNQ